MEQQAAGRFGPRIELLATILLAVATVATAWAAFQSNKWSGDQADDYAASLAARTSSAVAAGTANAETVIDVNTFVAWLQALQREQGGAGEPAGANWTPRTGTLSGFLYGRFRPEFKPAVQAWLATRPLNDPKAPPSPFALPEYRLAQREDANRLAAEADMLAAKARTANQRSDNYVFATVAFATVLFFAGISTKLEARRSKLLMLSLAGLVLLLAMAVVATLPVSI